MFTLEFVYHTCMSPVFHVSQNVIGYNALQKVSQEMGFYPETLKFVGEFDVVHKTLEIDIGVDDIKAFNLQNTFAKRRVVRVELNGILNNYSVIYVFRDKTTDAGVVFDLVIDTDSILRDFSIDKLKTERYNFNAESCLVFEKRIPGE